MCGIAGILNLANNTAPRREELALMMTTLHHRGPDGRGFHIDGPVGLAHTRLSIIDLTGGEQPIHNEDRSVWVTFNGEIFNYVELRQELIAQGHQFYTQSDTEVIVHLYEQHGIQFVDHLNGQFAIALWDSRRDTLILARDRTGIRPLFYTTVNQRLIFASEIKALFALPETRREIDPIALNEICTYWSPLTPRSIFRDVLSLPPGHVMVVTAKKIRLEQYWDWAFPDADNYDTTRNEADYADELRSLMIDAVRLQLRADVPVGAYLSGGLDSSIITSLIHHFTSTKLRTFSLTFDDAEFDERFHQQELVNYLGTDHSSLNCTRADIADAFPRTILHTETPIVRTAPTPLMLLSGHVRAAGYKVVLTGEGADEVFGGYDIFKEAKVRRFWARQPESAMRPRILERLYPYLKNSPMAGRAFTQSFFRDGLEQINEPFFAHLPRWTTTQRISQFFSSQIQEEIGERDPYAAVSATLPSNISCWAPMSRDQYVEAHTLMTGYLLCSQGDRVAMANSVEGRFPFLDHRVIEFANRLPPKLKMRGLVEKFILKKSMAGLLPETVRTRTKQPYRAPDSASFFEKGQPMEYVNDLLCSSSIASAGYFDPTAVNKLFKKCQAGRAIGFADNMAFVTILSTMLLHEQFINGRGVVPISTDAPTSNALRS
jgi:asparagine synthase (glutamine-hydrolysing)